MQRFRDYAFDWIAWIVFAAVPATIFWQSATALDAEGVASGGPMENAAFYPRIVASVMCGLLAWHAIQLGLARVRDRTPLRGAVATRLALLATALFVVYLIVLPYAGFHLATPLLCFLLFRMLRIGLIAAMAGGLGLSVALAFVFEAMLNVVLPVGVFNIALFN